MTQTQNGRADVVDAPIDLGDFLPERRPVTLNGNTYYAWVVKEGHYEREILAKLGRAYARYLVKIAPLTAIPLPVPEETEGPIYEAWKRQFDEDLVRRNDALANQELYYDEYLTEAVMILLPGLQETEARLIPRTKITGLFEDLGFWDKAVVQEVSDTASQPPLDGTTSPPDSSSSTVPVSESK